MTNAIGSIVPDRYELNARQKPTFLALLPIILVAIVWIPDARSLLGGAVSLAVTCGVTYFMSQLTRERGVALEDKWGDAIGRAHSARLLSWKDASITKARKQRLAKLASQFGPGLPSAAEEENDPRGAAVRRLDVVNWLLEATRGDAGPSLLLDENIAYGFWRNLRGLKPLALAAILVALAVDLWLIYRSGRDPRLTWGVGVALACMVGIFAWTVLVTKSRVIQASRRYADRLFSQVDNPSLRERLLKSSLAKA